MIREIDAGMDEPLYDELQNNGGAFDGTSFVVSLELVQIGGVSWMPATAYAVGDLTRAVLPWYYMGIPPPPHGRLYRCTVAGESDASTEPVWPLTFGGTVIDGTVTWQDITPNVAWYVQSVGQVVMTDYHGLPRDTSYRQRYVLTDAAGKRGPFPNLNRYNVWRVGAVMAG
jgi:hypothetical protein